MRILNIYPETISDGAGLRYAIYLSGCIHHCQGCHNVSSWSPEAGLLLTDIRLDEIIQEIRTNSMLDGITVSGGDPFYCPDELVHLLSVLKEETGMNIWCYTGYTIEELMAEPNLAAPLRYIDVLVDGRYEEGLRDLNLPFRGSKNQRIVKLRGGRPILDP